MTPGRILFALTVMLAAGSAVPVHAETIQVSMQSMVYAPAELNAKVGDTIAWVNNDILIHTATARNGDWDVIIPVKKTVNVVLKRAGTIDYYCKYHPNMKGRIVVAPN
jgi:plastocyanin